MEALHFNSNIDIGQIATAISLFIIIMTFIIKEIVDHKREIRSANREIYQRLELAAIDLFRFDASNIDLSGILWADDKEIPTKQDFRYAYLNYICQILNLFEMSIRFRREKVMPPEVFGSWVIWYYDLCERKNFKPIWEEVKSNYTCDLRKVIEAGIQCSGNDDKKGFFNYVSVEVKNCKHVKSWLLCGEKMTKKDCKNCLLSHAGPHTSSKKNEEAQHSEKINIEWCKSENQIDLIANIFSENIDLKYISHGEVQDGRALNFNTWRNDIKSYIINDFKKAFIKDVNGTESYKVAIASNETEIIGISFILIKKNDFSSFAEIQDLIIEKNMQNKGAGTTMLNWIENNLKKEGVKFIFLESGVKNEHAHEFFHRKGYNICSKVFFKEIE